MSEIASMGRGRVDPAALKMPNSTRNSPTKPFQARHGDDWEAFSTSMKKAQHRSRRAESPGLRSTF